MCEEYILWLVYGTFFRLWLYRVYRPNAVTDVLDGSNDVIWSKEEPFKHRFQMTLKGSDCHKTPISQSPIWEFQAREFLLLYMSSRTVKSSAVPSLKFGHMFYMLNNLEPLRHDS